MKNIVSAVCIAKSPKTIITYSHVVYVIRLSDISSIYHINAVYKYVKE